MNNKFQDKIQREAVESWINVNKCGTLNVSTGTGKTIMSLHCLYTMPRDKSVHLFLAETVEREKDLLSDIQLYNKLFNVDVLRDYNLKFKTYQAVYKLNGYEFGLIIADEVHFCLTPEYSKFFYNNSYQAIVGLSATIDRKIAYDDFTKGELLDEIAPICFTYTLAQAKNDGVGRNLNLYIINHELDSVNKTVLAGSKKKSFYQTELAVYTYWDKEHKRSWFIEDKETKDLKIRITSTKRSNILFNLPSKIELVKNLLKILNGKSIIFGNSLDALLKVTPNTVSSRYSEDKNKAIREAFDKGKIDCIGSFKKLLQGANLKELDNCIIMSYFSSNGQLIQKLGRLRKNKDKIGNAFIILTKNTQEEIWFTKMMEEISDDFNIIYCNNLQDCIKKYNENEENNTKSKT